MKYRVDFSESAKKKLFKLDRSQQKLLLSWIKKNLDGCENPRVHGRGLTGNKSGYWRYRVGDYRLIADISEREILITFVRIGHRSEIYD